ncbi:MAG: leucine--tRNA ligase [Fimbriimonas sp.]
MADRYEPSAFEAKWRDRWKESDVFETRNDPDRPNFYGLDFFPYPSGAGLSVGHCRNYVLTDVICRLKAMQGFNVLHPMGFDAFGLPAENEAIKRQSHPAPMIDRYAATYRRQMELVGISYDWSRSFKSSDPTYYKWTQWLFQQLYKKGLAYRADAPVNWCPKDKTALANEEVVGGLCERCGTPVEKRRIPQWYFRITDYAQRLLDDLEELDWPEGIKSQQRNWIGRSEGVEFTLEVALPPKEDDVDGDFVVSRGTKALTFEVFTTRVDTIFGVTFCVLAPEHALVEDILLHVGPEHEQKVRDYQAAARTLSDIDRTATNRPKTGVFTGAYAVNPANGKRVPIWLADYVLATYGTGAIMAVPAHDQRDFDFAVEFGLDIAPVIRPTEEYLGDRDLDAYIADVRSFNHVFESKDSTLIQSGEYTNLFVQEAQTLLGEWMEALGIGKRIVNYKLRDWLISRQRYWGCPIPIIHSAEGEEQLVSEDCLPVYLPEVDNYEPSGDGSSPLARIDDFVNVTDRDGRLGRRETDTMGGFACSSWYFLRFCDPFNEEAAWSQEAADRWMPVDCYVGGAEHAVMHLLYARFWTKVFYDLGLVKTKEPFKRLLNQGQVLGRTPYRKPKGDERLEVGQDGILVSFAEAAEMPEDELTWRWVRMSKSKGNVVTPEEAVEGYGADALRLQLLFIAPFNVDVEWKNEGMQGQVRFLSRVFRLVDDLKSSYVSDWRDLIAFEEMDELGRKIRSATHRTIQKAGDDIERFAMNTYVSSLMIYVNDLNDLLPQMKADPSRPAVLAISEAIESLILMLAPSAPHSADELWESIGRVGFTFSEAWPKYDPKLAVSQTIVVAVQVNGKLRDTLELPADATKEDLEEAAKNSAKIQTNLAGLTIRKVIVVPGKLVNIVAN